MLYFANWKILLICGVCALGVLFSLPNLFTTAQLSWLPGSVPHKQISLGLDLRGGSYLLLEVDVAAAQTEQLNSVIDNVRDALRTAKIGYKDLSVDGGAIVFTILDTDNSIYYSLSCGVILAVYVDDNNLRHILFIHNNTLDRIILKQLRLTSQFQLN